MFRQFNEVFNKPYKYTKVKEFKTRADKTYGSYFETDDGSEVDVIFSGNPHIDDYDHLDWEIEFERDGSQAITGEGDALRIIATVLKIVKDFIKIEDPKYMHLMAEKPQGADRLGGRERLYGRLIKKEIGNKYKVTADTTGSGTIWYIEKK